MPMNVKLPGTDQPWVDPDDAPELSDELFEKGAWKMGERVVTKQQAQTAIAQTMRRGRPLAQVERPMLSIRVDPEVLEKLRASEGLADPAQCRAARGSRARQGLRHGLG